MTRHSTMKRRKEKMAKPAKPQLGFPLYPHVCGRWAKTIRGKSY